MRDLFHRSEKLERRLAKEGYSPVAETITTARAAAMLEPTLPNIMALAGAYSVGDALRKQIGVSHSEPDYGDTVQVVRAAFEIVGEASP
jgi:hypothetical protein